MIAGSSCQINLFLAVTIGGELDTSEPTADNVDFTYYTDEPVRLATDLVNTLSPVTGRDELADPEALAQFLREHGREFPAPPTQRDLTEVRAHRALLREVFTAEDEPAAAELLNRLLMTSNVVPRIVGHDHGDGMHMHFESKEAGVADWIGAVCGMALAVVLCDYGKARFGICGSGSCEDAFIDMSKNRCKRYCSEGCAHRASVAAFRARKRQGAERVASRGKAGAGA
jgi:predicted RNA-binding Zn ribbon-like protein